MLFYGRSTALHVAAKRGNVDCVAELLQASLDLPVWDADGFSPLMLACLHGNPPTSQLLLNRTRPDKEEVAKCAFFAAASGQYDTLQMLVQDHNVDVKETVDGWSLLHAAAAWHRLDCVSYLLGAGASANVRCDGLTAIEVASIDQRISRGPGLGVHRPFEEHSDASRQRRDAIGSLLLTYGDTVDCALLKPNTAYVPDYVARLKAELQQTKATLQLTRASMQRTICSTDRSDNGVLDAMQAFTIESDPVSIVQLVHATTGVRSDAVYKLDATLLADLHKNSGGEMPSVLLNLVQPPEGFAAATASSTNQPGAVPLQLLTYDGM